MKGTAKCMRIGYGYDAHRLTRGRKCILCGIEIPCGFGPDGHSDADAPVHALIDALLGAAALGDIGKYFPDTDDSLKNSDSVVMLKYVYELVRGRGYVIGNADITIVLQAPRLSPYIEDMRACIAAALDTDIDRINVKATTEEKMGFTGDGTGISSMAAVLIDIING